MKEAGNGVGKKATLNCFLRFQMERGIWPNDFIPKHFTSQHLSWPQSTSSLRLPSMGAVKEPVYWQTRYSSVFWSRDSS